MIHTSYTYLPVNMQTPMTSSGLSLIPPVQVFVQSHPEDVYSTMSYKPMTHNEVLRMTTTSEGSKHVISCNTQYV